MSLKKNSAESGNKNITDTKNVSRETIGDKL